MSRLFRWATTVAAVAAAVQAVRVLVRDAAGLGLQPDGLDDWSSVRDGSLGRWVRASEE